MDALVDKTPSSPGQEKRWIDAALRLCCEGRDIPVCLEDFLCIHASIQPKSVCLVGPTAPFMQQRDSTEPPELLKELRDKEQGTEFSLPRSNGPSLSKLRKVGK